MDKKELAKAIIEKVQARGSDILGIRASIAALMHNCLADAKSLTGQMPTEAEFLDLLAEMLDMAIVLPQPLESIDGYIIRKVLGAVDKYALDKFFGPNWYADIVKKIEALEAAAVPQPPADAPVTPCEGGNQ